MESIHVNVSSTGRLKRDFYHNSLKQNAVYGIEYLLNMLMKKENMGFGEALNGWQENEKCSTPPPGLAAALQ